ncbi:MAG: acyltransferase family protein [Planctomycetota bacterium]|jgi:peptidoglycan/LPS O-acetylase OafA/YrhL
MSAQTGPASISRRHDLDALRAVAMMLGIVLHGAMSFIPGVGTFWGVQDVRSDGAFGLLLALIHGFRMPLFFLVSGFFTAMLWQKRGIRQLLIHRFKRIFLPMLLGLLTIIPATWAVTEYVRSSEPASSSAENGERSELAGNAEASGASSLIGAVAVGDIETVAKLIEAGGDLHVQDEFGSTPLHVACFFGRSEAAALLLEAGADREQLNNEGRRPAELLNTPWGVTSFVASMVSIEVTESAVTEGRREIAELMGIPAEGLAAAASGSKLDFSNPTGLLMYFPLFGHLWFLWFLCWLVPGFVICTAVGSWVGIRGLPRKAIISPWRLAWLIPLSALPLSQMSPVSFGPDTSIGLLPMPSVLAFYAIFFAFGACCFLAEDQTAEVGRHWVITLVLGIVVVFPVGLATYSQSSGAGLVIAALSQSAYAWLLTFGMMGLFRQLLSRESRTMRYLSDSSYWLYLAHIPLIIYVQYLVRDWQAPAFLKFSAVCLVTSGLLLVSYQLFVRYTPIGTLLNGRRGRPKRKGAPETSDSPAVETQPAGNEV